ncbi:MAG: hypothetical protein KGS61_10575 [Verrucomicrobia bacterium]|nr:hypothetical protein [Verrucomicrobiota bacterium]
MARRIALDASEETRREAACGDCLGGNPLRFATGAAQLEVNAKDNAGLGRRAKGASQPGRSMRDAQWALACDSHG